MRIAVLIVNIRCIVVAEQLRCNIACVWGSVRQVVLSLEGGYDLAAMCDCAQECVRALLGTAPAPAPARAELARRPHARAQDALRTALAVHSAHWPVLKRYADLLALSALEAAPLLHAHAPPAPAAPPPPPPPPSDLQVERDAADTAAAMATLSMHHAPHHHHHHHHHPHHPHHPHALLPHRYTQTL